MLTKGSIIVETTTPISGKLADPAFRHARAVKAARSRTTIGYHVQAVIDRAHELTPELAAELAAAITVKTARPGR